MIKELTQIDQYLDFISMLNADESYNDPMLSTDEQIQCNLLDAVKKDDDHVLGIFENDTIVGLFVFYVTEEEKYVEMLVGLSKSIKAYDELFEYLTNNYHGYLVDFVFNPKNDILKQKLELLSADFEIEQQKMVLKEYKKIHRQHNIIEWNPDYKDSYLSVHDDEFRYWIGSRVIDALDRFRVVICVINDNVVGYVDITYTHDENEPFDVFVLPEYRNKGIATEMLSYAIEKNGDKKLMLLVDITNEGAIHMYEKLGFEKTTGNNLTAHLTVK